MTTDTGRCPNGTVLCSCWGVCTVFARFPSSWRLWKRVFFMPLYCHQPTTIRFPWQ